MKVRTMMALLLTWSAGLSGCAQEKIVTITFPKKDGNSEYWVCDRDALSCRGRRQGDLEPTLYRPGLDTISPPTECDHGAARMEILVKGNQVVQIGYECAQPGAPTGLPLRPEGGDGDAAPTGLPDAPTGLPDAPTGLPDAPKEAVDAPEPGDDKDRDAADSDTDEGASGGLESDTTVEEAP